MTPNHEHCKAQGRGGPDAISTWQGWPTFSIAELGRFLSQLDETCPGLNVSRHPLGHVFTAFPIRSTRPTLIVRPSMETMSKLYPSSLGPDWDPSSRYLLHHYVNHVSPQMMPFHSPHNPWTTDYPRLALENQCVRDALLGQAAAHLYHLKCGSLDMEIRSLVHRGAALTHLGSILYKRDNESFEIKVATILSLIMADIYFGLSEGWRSHVLGKQKPL